MKSTLSTLLILLLSGCDFSCSGPNANLKNAQPLESKQEVSKVPTFDENYSFEVIHSYEAFGPKVPGTSAHQKAGNWIISELKRWDTSVLEQTTTAKTYDGKTIPVRNIITQINPTAKTRYLLSAHWDNRPFADEDKKDKTKPILGTNDGGSGVAVLLTIAKAMQNVKSDFGIDLAFWDAEDWGNARDGKGYCLGSEYWAKNPIPAKYHAEYGINYDMVGRIGSVFPIEGYSMRNAAFVYDKLHRAAAALKDEDFFPSYQIGPIIDDHYYVTVTTGIPMIDLIYMTENGMFPPEWHTHQDTAEFISRDILKVVGQTTLQMLFSQ